MRFLISKKSVQNREIPDNWRPEGTQPVKMRSPGGMRGATGEGTMGRGQRSLHEFCMQCEAEFCRMLTCVRHALPRLEARGGGKRERAFRRARFFVAVGLWVCGYGCLLCCVVARSDAKPSCMLCCGVVGLWCVCVCVLLAAWVPKSSKNLLRSPTSTKTEQKWDQNRPQMRPIWARGGGRGNRKLTKI